MAKQIPLSRGLFATVDDEDFEWLSQWKWSALRVQKGNSAERFYACRTDTSTGKQRMILMHRALAKPAARMNVDHRDLDTLNNRKGNLRHCNQGQNSLNQNGHSDRRGSRFKGVSWHKKNRKWISEFRGRYIGSFEKEEDAARAYDTAAVAYSPEYARPNFAMEA